MTRNQFKPLGLREGALLAFLILLSVNTQTAKAQGKTAADLIRFLTYQSDRPDKGNVRMGLFSCGPVTADLAAAKSLARLGDSAIPEIEKELDAIEMHGYQSGDGSSWLELAYARIKGPDAYPRLRRMGGNPRLGFDRHNLDSSIALSLSITSYVSDSRLLLRSIRCTRGPEPRDALDQLILAWERNDRLWLEASLGPRASAALNLLLKGRTWADLRAELWHGRSPGGVAVGYRFDIPGRWSAPQETLDEEGSSGAVALPDNPDLETRFKNGSGGDCGRRRVKFLKTPMGAGPGYLMYVVDNFDLGDLLRLIGSCATGDSVASER